jgi:uncharacterized protein
MNKIISILALIFILTSVSYGQIDKEYAKTLKKLFEVSGTEETYKAAIKQMVAMFRDQYVEIDSDTWDDLEKEFLKTSLDDLTDMLVPVYSKYMTQEDLEEIIKFYQSPVGQKYAANTPFIMQESMQVGQEWGREIGQKLEKKMKERNK